MLLARLAASGTRFQAMHEAELLPRSRWAALNRWDQRAVKKLFLVFSLLSPRLSNGSSDGLTSPAEAASEPRISSTDAAPWLPWLPWLRTEQAVPSS